MLSWLEYEILALPRTDYLVLLVVAIALLLYLIYFSFGTFRRFRYIEGTATSRIRSAAQGHVELKGLVEWMQDDMIVSPFSKRRCVWYHCTIEKKRRRGRHTSWTNITDELSGHLFQLVDETGVCIVDPDDAHVIPETDITWYGFEIERRYHPPSRPSWIRLGTGRYRFRERLIRPASQLYALGWFRTERSNPAETSIRQEVDRLLTQWKLHPGKYLAAYDHDQDGVVRASEWGVIRQAARHEVLDRLNREPGEHNVMSRPDNQQLPFVLSTTAEDALVTSKKRLAYGSSGLAFLIFGALVLIILMRPPFPV